jgi:predicted Zn-dependent peptidase
VDSLPQVTDAVIHGFRSKHFFGENCILAVAGMEHSTAVELVRKKFLALPAGTRRSDGSDMVAASRYTGGMLTLERELKEPFVKLAMGFEVGGWNDPLLVPVCVMQQLLGNIQVACDTVDIISNGGV